MVASVFADQPFWGMRMESLGAGVHLPFKQLNSVTLERALRRVLAPEFASKAQHVGRVLLSEPDATAAIVERIEAAGPIPRLAAATG